MTERERLIEIFKTTTYKAYECTPETTVANQFSEYALCHIVDEFLKKGVIVPTCKVGDTVWLTLELLKGGQELVESRCVKTTIISDRQIVYSLYINERAIGNTLEFYDDDFDKTVFLSREEAEKALGRVKTDETL